VVLAGKEYRQARWRRSHLDLALSAPELAAAVPGIVFLSGGQNACVATVRLNAINRLPGRRDWRDNGCTIVPAASCAVQ